MQILRALDHINLAPINNIPKLVFYLLCIAQIAVTTEQLSVSFVLVVGCAAASDTESIPCKMENPKHNMSSLHKAKTVFFSNKPRKL